MSDLSSYVTWKLQFGYLEQLISWLVRWLLGSIQIIVMRLTSSSRHFRPLRPGNVNPRWKYLILPAAILENRCARSDSLESVLSSGG